MLNFCCIFSVEGETPAHGFETGHESLGHVWVAICPFSTFSTQAAPRPRPEGEAKPLEGAFVRRYGALRQALRFLPLSPLLFFLSIAKSVPSFDLSVRGLAKFCVHSALFVLST